MQIRWLILGTSLFIFFSVTATTAIYTLSLHDALPIWRAWGLALLLAWSGVGLARVAMADEDQGCPPDRKSTRLNSSHANISYAVFFLKKKKETSLHRPATRPPASAVRRPSSRGTLDSS